MKIRLPTLLALAALLAAPAFGQDVITWTNAAGNNDFADGANWDPPFPPFVGSDNSWDVNLLGADRAVLSTNLTVQRDVRIGDTDGQGELLIPTGGNVFVTRNMRLGRGGDGVTGLGIATVDGGSLTISSSLFVGQSANPGNVFSLNSGSVSIGARLNVAHQANTYGTLNISGGTFNVNSEGARFSDGGGGPSTSFLNISGNGAMGVTGDVNFARAGGGAISTVDISDTASLTASGLLFGEGANSVASLILSDDASVLSESSIRFGFGENSTVTITITGGSLNATTSFITMGQGAGANVTVDMSGGEINADRLPFANNGTGTLNMTGGTINLVDNGGTQSTTGALVMGSAGATLHVGGDAVINADKLRINNGGLLTLSGDARVNIAGAKDENETLDFARGHAFGDWSEVLGRIAFNGGSFVVAGAGETITPPAGIPLEVNFADILNDAIAEGVIYTDVPGGRLEARYDAVADRTEMVLSSTDAPVVNFVAFREGGILHLAIEGPAGLAVNIETSIDLSEWDKVDEVTLDAEPTIWTDPDAGHAASPRRFYRGRFAP